MRVQCQRRHIVLIQVLLLQLLGYWQGRILLTWGWVHSALPLPLGHRSRSHPTTTTYTCNNRPCTRYTAFWQFQSVEEKQSGDAIDSQVQSPPPLHYYIRECLYGDLDRVSEVVMASFYATTTAPLWRSMYRLAELNRLQQNFSYSEPLHRMLVACFRHDDASSRGRRSTAVTSQNDVIVGFVDVDARIPNRPTGYQYNPRPYISDLCIHPDHRRQGLAQWLVHVCEDQCWTIWQRPTVYIRVERSNTAALHMYTHMGYREQEENDDDPSDKIVILSKSLQSAVGDESPSVVSLTTPRIPLKIKG
jgi:ribosomal protein S18 acetylase RimI-like enzyme